MNTCQFIFLSVIIAAAYGAETSWTGPVAPHKIGQVVEDTPEVAAAKRQHFEILAKALASFPRTESVPLVQAPQFPPQVVPQVVHLPVDDSTTQKTWPGPFADHVAGQVVQDTPDVAAIKQQHLHAFAIIRNALPELPVTTEQVQVQNQVHQVLQQNLGIVSSSTELPYVPVDTQEVVNARLEHARAVAALIGRY